MKNKAASRGSAEISKMFRHDQHKEHGEVGRWSEDWFSQLPDEILMLIVSRMPLREATITSTLSTRWRHFYKYITRVNFYLPGSVTEKISPKHFEYEEFPRCLDYIDGVLDRHKGNTVLEEFRMRIPKVLGADVYRWFEFALSKGVEVLDISLEECMCNGVFVTYLSYVDDLIDTYGSTLLGFKTLRTLSLSEILLNDFEVGFLLSNCEVLECLSITNQSKLKNLSVVGPKPLRHLDLSSNNIESIEIRDINLVSFKYRGCSCKLIMENVPCLIEIDSEDSMIDTYLQLSPHGSCHIDRLVKLTLDIYPTIPMVYDCLDKIGRDIGPPTLNHLTHLVLEVRMFLKTRILPLSRLIDESPLLEKFELKLSWSMIRCNSEETEDLKSMSSLEHPHYNLRLVKFSGYLGTPPEWELVLYMMKNAVKLEEFSVKRYGVRDSDIEQLATALSWCHFKERMPKFNLDIL